MENIKTNTLIAQRIGKINDQRLNKKHFTWISDIYFNAKEKETISFIFASSNEKKAFINIFTNNKSNFLGYFEYKDKIYYSTSKEKLSSIVSYNDLQTLNQNFSNAMNFLYNEEMVKNQSNEYKLLINEGFKLSTFLKNNILVQSKKIEIEYFTKINQEIRNILENFKNISKHNNSLNKKTNIKNIFDFRLYLNSYKHYLKKRVEFLYKRNSNIINLFLQHFEGDVNKNQITINNKINQLTKEIEELQNKINYSSTNSLSKNKIFKKELYELKIKNMEYLKFLNQEFKYFSIKYKYRQKKSIKKDLKISNYFNYIISNFYRKKIHKIQKNILYLFNDDIKEFLNAVQKAHSDAITEAPLLPKKLNKRFKAKRIILKWIKNDLDLIKKTYISKSNQNVIQLKNNLISNYELEQKKQEEFLNSTSNIQLIINQKNYERQRYIDEYIWNNTNVNIGISSEMSYLNEEALEQIEIYKELKKKLSNSLQKIMLIFDKASMNEKSLRKNSLANKLTKQDFIKKIEKIENNYSHFKNDMSIIDELINGKTKEESKQKFINLFFKYKVFNLALKNKLTIMDLFKNIDELDELQKSKILLTKCLLENKEINIFSELIDNLTSSEVKIFKEIYEYWTKTQNNIWIHLSNKINSIKVLSNKLYIIYNTKSVEFGKSKKIVENPKHWYTKKILGAKSKKNVSIPKNNVFEEFDFYQVEEGHYLFVKLEDYWEEYKQYLDATIWTNKIQKLELFNISKKQKVASKKYNSSKIELNVEDIESVIIDVRKKTKKN